MKKLLCGILSLLISFSLAGCGQKQAANTNMTPSEIAEVIFESQSGLPELMQVTATDTDFSTWLSDYYLIPTEQVEDGVIYYADGVEASEITVLVLTDEKNAEAVQTALNKYIEGRAGVFEGYAPQQAAMAKEGIIAANGRYIVLLICPQPQSAKKAFLECFGKATGSGGNSTEDETNKANVEEDIPQASSTGTEESAESAEMENSYNAEAVLEAYRSGDDSPLSEINRSILKAAREVIGSEINDDMSDYEKELAIHDYITEWSRFDYSVFGRSGSDGFTDGSNTPYGVLIDRSAMCHGYSSTFQLFMDMLDIECMTVFGTPNGNGVQHSWNMVKLDDEWYCVDCAWDDPIGGSPCHTYFNVTSDYLRSGSIHRWDESSVPEATGTTYAYGNY